MNGWNGLGRMRRLHPARIRRIDLGDTVTWRGEGPLRVRGVMIERLGHVKRIDRGRLYVLLDLNRGPCWVASAHCDLLAEPESENGPKAQVAG